MNHEKKTVSLDFRIHAERKRIIVAFADIVGFAPWIRRASTSPEEVHPLLQHLYRNLFRLHNQRGYFVKLLADGGMLVKELNRGHNCRFVLEVLNDMNDLHLRMTAEIQRNPWPRPAGFRIRLASGRASKFNMKLCERDCFRQHDYVGYPTVLAARALQIAKDVPIVCHESVKDLIRADKAEKEGLRFIPASPPEEPILGIDAEDLKDLWIVEFANSQGE